MAGQEFTWHTGLRYRTRNRRAAAGYRSGVCACPDPAEPALVCAPFIFAHAAPDARVLAALHRPLQAALGHRAPAAYPLGLFDLEQRGPCVSDREEQLRIHLAAGGVVAPVHAVHSSIPGRADRPESARP